MGEWATVAVLGLVLGYAAISRRMEGTVVSAAMVFVGAGLLVGPGVLGWLRFDGREESLKLLAEATLAIVLFTDASRIDLRLLRRELAVPARLLGLGLPLTIAAGTGAAVLLLGDLGLAEALVLSVVLAPTDAALGQAVVTDRRLPSRVRQSLNVESGLNDGLCVPLLVIALALAGKEEGIFGGGHAIRLVVDKVGWGVIGGLIGGLAGAAVLTLAVARRLVAAEWVPIAPVAAAGLAFAVAEGLGGSGFVAAFVGGLLYGRLLRGAHPEATAFAESVALVLNAATFVAFGVIASGLLETITGPMVAYAILSLTLVRMLRVAAALVGTRARPPTVALLGGSARGDLRRSSSP